MWQNYYFFLTIQVLVYSISKYLKAFRSGFKQQLMGVKVVDEEGNDITPQKLKDEKLKN